MCPERIGAGARQVQSLLQGARDRAIHTGEPRGVRFFVDADADALLNQNTDPGEVPTIEVIPERAALKRKLRRLVKEQAGAGAGLPAVDDLAKKLSAAGAEETLSYLRRLMDKVSFAGGDEVEEPALPPELPPADDMVPPDEM